MTRTSAHALATAVVSLHVVFVLFVIFGGALVLRRPKVAYVHLPAVAWAIYVEWAGAICPLTPFENSLRAVAGLEAYSGDFVAAYVFPVLYPDGLTRAAQLAIGAAVLAINAWIYATLLRQRRSNTFAS
jgi:uncharacterized protein DUF2784